ncbi:uncharacterized protein LOC113790314 isoform X2 [Dermatophagoides pteronyssinus]|uniref:uncharacterized protein LOC113790314 isoform X2 n=2 Tax=Dermatophagoides pteronyssinus TaxID=6956 RepID=UPI003F675355
MKKMLPNPTSTNQIVHRPKQQRIVDRFSYLLRKCPPPGSSTTSSSSSVTFHPLINRVTRIGSGIQANLRIRDQDNIDTIHAEIHQSNDNPFNDYDNDHQYGQKFNILKTISCRKPTFLNDQLLNSGENRLLRHQDRLTFGGGEIDFGSKNRQIITTSKSKRHDFIFEIQEIQQLTSSSSSSSLKSSSIQSISSSLSSLTNRNKISINRSLISKKQRQQQQRKYELRVATLRKNHLVATSINNTNNNNNNNNDDDNNTKHRQQQRKQPKTLSSLNRNSMATSSNQITKAMNMDSNSSDNVDDNDDDDDNDKWKHYHEQVQEQQNDDDNEGQYLEQQQEQSSLMIDPKTMSMMNEHRFYTESIPSISIRMTTPSSSIVWTPISQSNHQTTAAVTNENNQQNRINRRYPIEYLDIETPKKKCNNNKVLPMSLLTLNFNLTSSISTTTATTKIDHERKNLMTLSHDDNNDNNNNDPETKFKQQQQIRIMDQTGLFLGLGKHQQQQLREIIIKAHKTDDGNFEIQINNVSDNDDDNDKQQQQQRIIKSSTPLSTSMVTIDDDDDENQHHEKHDNNNNDIIDGDNDNGDNNDPTATTTTIIAAENPTSNLINIDNDNVDDCQMSPITTQDVVIESNQKKCRRMSSGFRFQIEHVEIEPHPSSNDNDVVMEIEELNPQPQQTGKIEENDPSIQDDNGNDGGNQNEEQQRLSDEEGNVDTKLESENSEIEQQQEEFDRIRSKSIDLAEMLSNELTFQQDKIDKVDTKSLSSSSSSLSISTDTSFHSSIISSSSTDDDIVVDANVDENEQLTCQQQSNLIQVKTTSTSSINNYDRLSHDYRNDDNNDHDNVCDQQQQQQQDQKNGNRLLQLDKHLIDDNDVGHHKPRKQFSIYTGLIRQLFQSKTPVADYVTYVDQLVELFNDYEPQQQQQQHHHPNNEYTGGNDENNDNETDDDDDYHKDKDCEENEKGKILIIEKLSNKKIIRKSIDNVDEKLEQQIPTTKTIREYNLRRRKLDTIIDTSSSSHRRRINKKISIPIKSIETMKSKINDNNDDDKIIIQTKKMKIKKLRKLKATKRRPIENEKLSKSSSLLSVKELSLKKNISKIRKNFRKINHHPLTTLLSPTKSIKSLTKIISNSLSDGGKKLNRKNRVKKNRKLKMKSSPLSSRRSSSSSPLTKTSMRISLSKNLKKTTSNVIIGKNLGKNKKKRQQPKGLDKTTKTTKKILDPEQQQQIKKQIMKITKRKMKISMKNRKKLTVSTTSSTIISNCE